MRLAAAATVTVTALVLAPLAGATSHAEARVPASSADTTSAIHVLLPRSLCTAQHGSRFTTTTDGGFDHGLDGGFLAEPARSSVKPAITAQRALHNFEVVYGPITAVERSHTQVRFGLASDLEQGPASGNVINYVPFIRRTPAWIVSNCVDAPSPADYYGKHQVGGTEIAIIADTTKPTQLGFTFQPPHPTPSNSGEDTAPSRPRPAPGATPYWSTAWTVAKHLKNGSIVLRYQPRRCYTLDHVNFEGSAPYPTDISVILSSGPNSGCPKPSATAPYVEIKPGAGSSFTKLRHQRTGSAHFEPESS